MTFVTLLVPLTQQGHQLLNEAWLQGTSTHVPVYEIPTQSKPVCGLGGVLLCKFASVFRNRSTHAEVRT